MKIVESIVRSLSEGAFQCLLCEDGACENSEIFCFACHRELKWQLKLRSLGPEDIGGLKVLSAGSYEGAWAKVIKILKVQPKDYLARPLVAFLERLLDYWRPEIEILKANAIVRVPSNPVRVFVESDLPRIISKECSKFLHVPEVEGLSYPKFFWSQKQRKSLNRIGRVWNLEKHPFRCAEKINLLEKKILLIDDVCTTGSTLRSCRDALESRGAQVVGAFVLARV